MKIKYKNNEAHVRNLNDLIGLNLERGCITFLIPYTNSVQAVNNINENVTNQDIKLKATELSVELICNYIDIEELERDLMGYQRALELYIDDLELDRQIDRRLRLKIMWLCLHIEGTIFNLLV